MPERPSKIAIVGAGRVGTTIAYAAMMRGIAEQIALFDVNLAKVSAEALDLNYGVQYVPMVQIEGSADVAICANADVVVITAGARQKPGQTQTAQAEANVGIFRTLLPELLRVAPDAVCLIVTNPVDVMTYAALKLAGLPPQRVFG